MAEDSGQTLSRRAYQGVLGAGLLLSLAANLPGHMSVDSVIALEEARTGVRQTWAPAAFSAALKVFDTLLSGTGLYVAAATGLLFATLMALPAIRGRAGWVAVLAAVLAVLTPQLLIYPGIVWRDILFAEMTLAGFVLIAGADASWSVRPPWLRLAGAAACLALAAAVRQNGLVVVVFAAVAVGWVARAPRWPRRLVWGVGFLMVTLVLALGIDRLATPPPDANTPPRRAQTLILEHYDIVGAVAHDPSLRLDRIAAADPAAAAQILAKAPRYYSPSRVDPLDTDEQLRRSLWRVPDEAMTAQWRDVILHHPSAYLAHRLDVFRWTLMTPDITQCVPVQLGVQGPPDMIDDLELAADRLPRDGALYGYVMSFYRTPIFSHLAWAVVGLLVAVRLLARRAPGDVPLAGLMLGSVGFAASFLPISVACDYRYLYLVDLAAIAGGLYVALDLGVAARVRVKRR